MVFQMMFAVITPALITGAFAERKRFKAFVVFTLLWATLVYDPVAHWVWGVGGWLRELGALDFAGGTVVHITSGVSALVAALVLGQPRRPRQREDGAARPDDDRARRRPALVRLVRLQRRQRARRQRSRRDRVRDHQHRGCDGRAHLDDGVLAAQGRTRACSARRPARSPAWSRSPRRPASSTPTSAIVIGLGAGVVCYFAIQLHEASARRRRARRLRRPRRRRHLGRHRDRPLRQQGGQQRGCGRPPLRQPGPARDPARRRVPRSSRTPRS